VAHSLAMASPEDAYDEEEALLKSGETERQQQHEKSRTKVLIAFSNLRGVSIAMLLCVALSLSIVSARLELSDRLKWPIFIDFIPLFIFPCLAYIAAMDFAATRISPNAALGKVVIIATGFLGSCGLLLLLVLIEMRLSNSLEWKWTTVLAPFWMIVFVSQFFFCFLIPGFLRNDMLKLFFGAFLTLWVSALVILLAALKLDGELQVVPWWVLLTPVWLILLIQVAVLEKQPLDVASRLILLVGAILLPLRFDGTITLPWALILLLPVCAIMLNIVQMASVTSSDL